MTASYEADIARHPLAKLWRDKLRDNDDLKILIEGANADTGIGKNTLAITIAEAFDLHGFDHTNATHYAQGNPGIYDCASDCMGYIDLYEERPKGSVLIWDEIGVDAGSKMRATSNATKVTGDVWQLYRDKCMCSIGIIPSSEDLVSRLERYTDIVIEIVERGKAKVAQVNFNLPDDRYYYDQYLCWRDLPDHEAYDKIEEMKHEFRQRQVRGEDPDEDNRDPEEVERDTRVEIAQSLRQQNMTIREIADAIGMSKSWVGENTSSPSGHAD